MSLEIILEKTNSGMFSKKDGNQNMTIDLILTLFYLDKNQGFDFPITM